MKLSKSKKREKRKKLEANKEKARANKTTQDGKSVYQKLRKSRSVGRSGIDYIKKYRETADNVTFERAKKESDSE